MAIVEQMRESVRSVNSATWKSQDVASFPWQREALTAWSSSGRRGIVQAVSGTGKTRVGLAAIQEAALCGKRTVVIVPSAVLMRRWELATRVLLPDLRIATDQHHTSSWDVMLSTAYVARSRRLLRSGEHALLIADECHHRSISEFARTMPGEYDWRLGLTAIAEREGAGQDTIAPYFGDVVFNLGYERACAERLIAPFMVAFAGVPLASHEREEYDELDAHLRSMGRRLLSNTDPSSVTQEEFMKTVVLRANNPFDPQSKLAQCYLAYSAKRQNLLDATTTKQQVLTGLAPAIRSARGAIVFTQTKTATGHAATALIESGCTSAAVHASSSDDQASVRIVLSRGQTEASMASPQLLHEGVQVPDADLGIVMVPCRSQLQVSKHLGRIIGRAPGKTAKFVVLYASETIEDPLYGIPSLRPYDDCLPAALTKAHFDLAKGDFPTLLRFLGASESEASWWGAQQSSGMGPSSSMGQSSEAAQAFVGEHAFAAAQAHEVSSLGNAVSPTSTVPVRMAHRPSTSRAAGMNATRGAGAWRHTRATVSR